VQERCALLYGQHYSMAISHRGGYRVELKLPLAAAPDSPSTPRLASK
jgi:hypothetical protein